MLVGSLVVRVLSALLGIYGGGVLECRLEEICDGRVYRLSTVDWCPWEVENDHGGWYVYGRG